MRYEIDIEKFAKKFAEEYELLYDNRDNVAGYREAVQEGDEFIRLHPEFVGEFAKYRGDLITSDRELAAFMLALNGMEPQPQA